MSQKRVSNLVFLAMILLLVGLACICGGDGGTPTPTSGSGDESGNTNTNQTDSTDSDAVGSLQRVKDLVEHGSGIDELVRLSSSAVDLHDNDAIRVAESGEASLFLDGCKLELELISRSTVEGLQSVWLERDADLSADELAGIEDWCLVPLSSGGISGRLTTKGNAVTIPVADSGAQITVLGTTFAVIYEPADNGLTVFNFDGEVRIEAPGAGTFDLPSGTFVNESDYSLFHTIPLASGAFEQRIRELGPAAAVDDVLVMDADIDSGSSGDDTELHPAEKGWLEVAGNVELEVWYPAEEEELWLAALDRARELRGDIRINALAVQGIPDQFTVAAQAGEGPDLLAADSSLLYQWVENGFVANIDSSAYLNDLSTAAFNAVSLNDAVYSIPYTLESIILYYNKAAVPFPPKSMDALIEEVAAGNWLVSARDAYHLYPFFSAYGGRVERYEGSETYSCLPGSDSFSSGLELLLVLAENGATFSSDYDLINELFTSGEAAMAISGSWNLELYREALGSDLGVAPIPAGTVPARPVISSNTLMVSTFDENQAAAIALAQFLSVQKEIIAGRVPARIDIGDDPLFPDYQLAAENGYPASAVPSSYWSEFPKAIELVLNGELTPEEAASSFCSIVE